MHRKEKESEGGNQNSVSLPLQEDSQTRYREH